LGVDCFLKDPDILSRKLMLRTSKVECMINFYAALRVILDFKYYIKQRNLVLLPIRGREGGGGGHSQ